MAATPVDLAAGVRRRRENFPVATRVLPRRYRHHLLAAYDFARLVDDVGDEAPPTDRVRLLDEIEADLSRLYSGVDARLPVVRALAPTVAACTIPAQEFRALVAANRRDQEITRYATFADLMDYCALSANPVGHIVLHIFGAATRRRLRLADRICSALQIIEHCQDVGEDNARGRVYLPAQDLRRFGCTDSDLAAAVTPTRLRGVVALQARRARDLLESGAPLVGALSGFARVAVAGYVAGGRCTLTELARARGDVLGRPVRPRPTRLLAEWPATLLRWR